jgi:CxxC motif-containing protein (DUF1111 family)
MPAQLTRMRALPIVALGLLERARDLLLARHLDFEERAADGFRVRLAEFGVQVGDGDLRARRREALGGRPA